MDIIRGGDIFEEINSGSTNFPPTQDIGELEEEKEDEDDEDDDAMRCNSKKRSRILMEAQVVQGEAEQEALVPLNDRFISNLTKWESSVSMSELELENYITSTFGECSVRNFKGIGTCAVSANGSHRAALKKSADTFKQQAGWSTRSLFICNSLNLAIFFFNPPLFESTLRTASSYSLDSEFPFVFVIA
jgi:hypothetical protein